MAAPWVPLDTDFPLDAASALDFKFLEVLILRSTFESFDFELFEVSLEDFRFLRVCFTFSADVLLFANFPAFVFW